MKYHAKYQRRYFKVAVFRFSTNQFEHTQALKQKTRNNHPTELWEAPLAYPSLCQNMEVQRTKLKHLLRQIFSGNGTTSNHR